MSRLAKIFCCVFVLLFSNTVDAAEPLVFAVHPYLPATELVKKFTPLTDYLSAEIGQPIEIAVSRDYQDHIQKTGGSNIDIAYMGPAGYVKMVREFGRKPLLGRLEVNGIPFFQGVIVIRADSSITSFKGLTGKKFAFGDPDSTMSHLVPRYMLLKEGLTVKDLGRHAFLKNHNNVALGVLAGDYDVGAVKEEVYFKYAKRGLKVLRESPSISEHVFVAGSKLSSVKVQKLRTALYALRGTEKGRQIMKSIKHSITGVVAVKDEDYDNLREILKELEGIGIN